MEGRKQQGNGRARSGRGFMETMESEDVEERYKETYTLLEDVTTISVFF